MQIACTTLRITPEEAKKLCETENNGLIGRIIDGITRRSTEIRVIGCRQFYYPYYCMTAEMRLPLFSKQKDRVIYERLVVEGGFGAAQSMQGQPETQLLDVAEERVVKTQYTAQQACERAQDFLRKKCFRKYQMYPSFQFPEVQLIYKPLYAVCCQRRSRKFYRIVDAEVGVKDYALDIRYHQMQFLGQPQQAVGT